MTVEHPAERANGIDDHGHTPAAWVGALMAICGFVTGGLGLILGAWPVIGLGAALIALAPITGKILQMAGFGHRQPLLRPLGERHEPRQKNAWMDHR